MAMGKCSVLLAIAIAMGTVHGGRAIQCYEKEAKYSAAPHEHSMVTHCQADQNYCMTTNVTAVDAEKAKQIHNSYMRALFSRRSMVGQAELRCAAYDECRGTMGGCKHDQAIHGTEAAGGGVAAKATVCCCGTDYCNGPKPLTCHDSIDNYVWSHKDARVVPCQFFEEYCYKATVTRLVHPSHGDRDNLNNTKFKCMGESYCRLMNAVNRCAILRAGNLSTYLSTVCCCKTDLCNSDEYTGETSSTTSTATRTRTTAARLVATERASGASATYGPTAEGNATTNATGGGAAVQPACPLAAAAAAVLCAIVLLGRTGGAL